MVQRNQYQKYSNKCKGIEQKGMHLNNDFYVVVGKQCRTENKYTGHQYNILYKLTNVLLSFICFNLVLRF